MAQKLVLPFKRNIVSAGFTHPQYLRYYGYNHYGWDMGCDEDGYNVLALGEGVVVRCAYDRNVGNVLLIRYNNVQLNDGKVRDIICRMYHLKNYKVKQGMFVHKSDVIAEYGNTGSGGWGIHLHIEFDTDTQYPCYVPSVKGSNIIKSGNAKTIVSPSNVFNLDTDQTIRNCPANNGKIWSTADELNLPKINKNICPTCGRPL